MTRKLYIWAFAVTVLIAGGTLIFINQPPQVASGEELRTKLASMPQPVLSTLDGIPFEIPAGLNTVIIYFNSTCEHCQRELTKIDGAISLFTDAQLVFVSAEPADAIKEFAGTLKMKDRPGVYFTHIEYDELARVFGVLGVPQIFVYDRQGKLLELYSGEPEIVEIVSTFKNR